MKKRFTEEQIVRILTEAEAGMTDARTPSAPPVPGFPGNITPAAPPSAFTRLYASHTRYFEISIGFVVVMRPPHYRLTLSSTDQSCSSTQEPESSSHHLYSGHPGTRAVKLTEIAHGLKMVAHGKGEGRQVRNPATLDSPHFPAHRPVFMSSQAQAKSPREVGAGVLGVFGIQGGSL